MAEQLPNAILRIAALLLLASVYSTPIVVAAVGERPVLVVVVSVDQWRYEYFERFKSNLSSEGIASRTQTTGLWLKNCLHDHAFTYTAPGHSVFMTGAYPSRSGIIDNNWYDRTAGTEVYCVRDALTRIIGTTNEETLVSPKNLLVDTVGDQLKLASKQRAKIFGIAIKDRAAILMAGHMADAAYWMSSDGKWITTDYYRDTLPGYLRNLNEQRAAFRYTGKSWDLLYDPSVYVHGPKENSEHERPQYEMSLSFPHVLTSADNEDYIKQLTCSPFGNTATLEAAREIVTHEQLGKDEHPDILAINLSSTDYVGHAFGPYGLEVEDMTYRTDIALGQFTEFLDEYLGERPWMVIVVSDHGIAPIAERATEWKLQAKRNPFGECDDDGNFETTRQIIDAHLRTKLKVAAGGDRLVSTVGTNQVFLNQDHAALRGDRLLRARRLVKDHLTTNPAISVAVTRDRLMQDCSSDKMLAMIQRSFHAAISGDVLFVLKPYHFMTETAATNHGSPWHYDRHVPLMIVGNRHRASWANAEPQAVRPASIAPTISRLLNIEMPSACMVPAMNLRFQRTEIAPPNPH